MSTSYAPPHAAAPHSSAPSLAAPRPSVLAHRAAPAAPPPQVLHHPHTKTDADPDEELPLLRLNARAPWAHIHVAQVFSQLLLGCFLCPANSILEFAIYVIERGFLDENLRRREGKPSRTNPLNALASLVFLQGLPFFFNDFEHAWKSALFSTGMYGIILLHTFHVSHIIEHAATAPFKPGVDWGAHQVATSANVTTWFEMGTLDLQVEHHLFPNLAYDKQQKVRHIVRDTCKEFGLTYFEHRSLMHAYAAHIDWIQKMGVGRTEQQTLDLNAKCKCAAARRPLAAVLGQRLARAPNAAYSPPPRALPRRAWQGGVMDGAANTCGAAVLSCASGGR